MESIASADADDRRRRPESRLTFLLAMMSMKARLCLWTSRPGFGRDFRKSTKSRVARSVSMLDWRLMDGLGVLPSWFSVGDTRRLITHGHVPLQGSTSYLTDPTYWMRPRATRNRLYDWVRSRSIREGRLTDWSGMAEEASSRQLQHFNQGNLRARVES